MSAGGVPALPSPGGALPYLRFTAEERRVLDALRRAGDFLVWGDVLTLTDGEEVVARFTAGE